MKNLRQSFKSLTAIVLLTLIINKSMEAQTTNNATKTKLLIHVTVGPENPTKAALAFLVAKTAVEE
ncbi:hypothetical protein ABTE18_20685, partial [Acinetobacter baumannii]